eukprot:2274022-Rhodomonas_salina.6
MDGRFEEGVEGQRKGAGAEREDGGEVKRAGERKAGRVEEKGGESEGAVMQVQAEDGIEGSSSRGGAVTSEPKTAPSIDADADANADRNADANENENENANANADTITDITAGARTRSASTTLHAPPHRTPSSAPSSSSSSAASSSSSPSPPRKDRARGGKEDKTRAGKVCIAATSYLYRATHLLCNVRY